MHDAMGSGTKAYFSYAAGGLVLGVEEQDEALVCRLKERAERCAVAVLVGQRELRNGRPDTETHAYELIWRVNSRLSRLD